MGLSNDLSCEAGSFSCCRVNPHGCFQSEVWVFLSPSWSPGLRGLFRSLAVPPGLSTCECGVVGSASCCTACPVPSTIRQSLGLASLPQVLSVPAARLYPPLLVWTTVSSLSPWLSDFRAVWFSVSSGWFLLLDCCPSFGCVRRHIVSTYTSILNSQKSILMFLKWTSMKLDVLCLCHKHSLWYLYNNRTRRKCRT